MSERKWYERKSEIFWAAVFAVVLLAIDKVLHVIIGYYPALPSWVKWSLILLPWLILFIPFYLYFKWRGRANKLADKVAELQADNKWVGIERVTGLDKYIDKLEGSGHHPNELLDKIDLKLDFMGHGASKWTANRDKLEAMLRRIDFNQGKARFLVINPLQTGLETERAQKIARSLRTLRELKNKHTNLEVRVYEHIPQLRLTFYDDNLVVVGHYQGLERQDSSNTPLLLFKRQCEWSFYKAFLSHFDEEWNRAIDLSRLNVEAVEDLARA